jgi:hypothetical protein
MRTTEQNRLASAPRRLQTDIQAHITWLNTRLAALDDDLDTTLRASPVVQSKYSNSHGYTRVVPRLLVAKPCVCMPRGGPVREEGTT